MENVQTLAQPGAALFPYVGKMAAVEYEKCASIHTSRIDRYTSGYFQYNYFAPI